ncbi:type II toxin-antitoxin system RelE/ParE family toxin [Candidatus Micrarchaeota archaeon]|nr:type II toxin-antitoxin system RelE/ParE family toxin [Candidatus Micrarchaeota archaeon]
MYEYSYSDEFLNKLVKLKKRDPNQYKLVKKKVDQICNSPNHSYKYLKHHLKKLMRVHIGHFVLVFQIDHKTKTVSFEDYEHHDKIYLNS